MDIIRTELQHVEMFGSYKFEDWSSRMAKRGGKAEKLNETEKVKNPTRKTGVWGTGPQSAATEQGLTGAEIAGFLGKLRRRA